MNNNFGSNIKTNSLPHSEIYLRQSNSEYEINHQRTYSLGIEKTLTEKVNTLSQMDSAKHEINFPLIMRQQSGLDFQFNIDGLALFNQQHCNTQTLMNSNFATANLIKFGSNNELIIEEDRQFTPPEYQDNIQSNHNIQSTRKISQKFKAVGNLVLGIRRLQQNVVEQIKSPQQFYEKFNPSPCQTSKNNKIHPQTQDQDFITIVNQFKLVYHFTHYSMLGSNEDIQKMMQILQKDPKRHIMNPQDPNHVINQFNQYGQNALYIAAKNGNDKVVKFLLSIDCNPYIRSKIYQDVTESPLEVSVRWHHPECVKLLIDQVKFSDLELRQALKLSQTQEISILLKRKMSSSIFSCCL